MDGGKNGRSGFGGTLDYRWPKRSGRVKIRCSGTIVSPICGPIGGAKNGPIINRKGLRNDPSEGDPEPFSYKPIRFEKGFAKGPIGGAKNGPHYPNDETVFDTVCKQRFLYLNEPTAGGPEPFLYKPRPQTGPSIPGGPRPFLYLNEWAEKIDVHSGINMEKSI